MLQTFFVFHLQSILHLCRQGRVTEYCAGGKIEKNEIGGACGAYGGGERGAQDSGGGGKESTGETQTQMGG